jgi:hypothetical protein
MSAQEKVGNSINGLIGVISLNAKGAAEIEKDKARRATLESDRAFQLAKDELNLKREQQRMEATQMHSTNLMSTNPLLQKLAEKYFEAELAKLEGTDSHSQASGEHGAGAAEPNGMGADDVE